MDVIPGWATGLFTMERADAEVKLKRQGGRLELGLDAVSGSERITGLLQRRGDEQRGAFLAKSGLLSAGVALGGDDPGVTLLAGDGWLKEHLAALGATRGAAKR
jgi:hypothetical protein